MDQGIDAPLPASQEVVATNASIQERVANLEARERRLQEWQESLEKRERDLVMALERRYIREMAGQAGPKEVAKHMQAAIMSVEAVEEAGGGEALGNTRRHLEEEACAKHAASAYKSLAKLAESCDNNIPVAGKVQDGQRACRDFIVVECRSQAAPADRKVFLEAAEEAFGSTLDRELRAVLLLAYHKNAKGKPDSVMPNSQLATARRGRPRPRRSRAAVRKASSSLAEEHREQW